MLDEADSDLNRLFRAAEQHFDPEPFSTRLRQRLQQGQRWRRLRWTAAALAAGGALAWTLYALVWLPPGAAPLVQMGQWLLQPGGWLCSLALGSGLVLRLRIRAHRR